MTTQDSQSVCAAVARNLHTAGLLGIQISADESCLTAQEVGDGNLNLVFIVRGPNGNAVVAKQSLPYVRCVGEDFPLTERRAWFESQALSYQHSVCPEFVPQVYEFDEAANLTLMRFVEPPHMILRKALVAGHQYSTVAKDVGTFLAKTLFFSSLFHHGARTHRELVAKFTNVELCQLTEAVVFTDPFVEPQHARFPNKWTSPQLDADAAALDKDIPLKVAVAALKHKFMTNSEALIHGDLHTGSIMAKEGSTFVIDPEFAFYGPMGFDIGLLIANLLLSYCAQKGHRKTVDRCDSMQDWLLDQIIVTWTTFEELFTSYWENPATCTGDASPHFAFPEQSSRQYVQRAFFSNLLEESLGFAGCEMIRRIFGVAHVEDFDRITDQNLRAECERKAVKIARLLILEGEFEKIGDVVEEIRLL
eukprot:c12164_g1_i1.p1 GENE.c12164_g1_i1~~c12164_g1_i1.p1  ORF type:complete len:435 (+),score=97.51 c12164_g1_i1:46-1305(+)